MITRRNKRLELVKQYGFDYEARLQAWLTQQRQDPSVCLHLKDLLRELIKRGLIERRQAPSPYNGLVVWRLVSQVVTDRASTFSKEKVRD